jgi:hypothetical protein
MEDLYKAYLRKSYVISPVFLTSYTDFQAQILFIQSFVILSCCITLLIYSYSTVDKYYE